MEAGPPWPGKTGGLLEEVRQQVIMHAEKVLKQMCVWAAWFKFSTVKLNRSNQQANNLC